MTYAGLKSMIYAGLTRMTTRQGCTGLILNTTAWTKPGLGHSGFTTITRRLPRRWCSSENRCSPIARARSMTGERPHRGTSQASKANGSWVNQADSFMEGDPNIVTSYALLALSYARSRD